MMSCKKSQLRHSVLFYSILFSAVCFTQSLTSCRVRGSCINRSSLVTDGHSSALPFLGFTDMPSIGKFVSPPSSTSERYRKKVRIRGPHARYFCALFNMFDVSDEVLERYRGREKASKKMDRVKYTKRQNEKCELRAKNE